MRAGHGMALVLAMSAGTAIAVAQLVKEEPAVGTAVKVKEQSHDMVSCRNTGHRTEQTIMRKPVFWPKDQTA